MYFYSPLIVVKSHDSSNKTGNILLLIENDEIVNSVITVFTLTLQLKLSITITKFICVINV